MTRERVSAEAVLQGPWLRPDAVPVEGVVLTRQGLPNLILLPEGAVDAWKELGSVRGSRVEDECGDDPGQFDGLGY